MSLILTPDEVTIILVALSGTIEDLTETSTNVKLPLNPEARTACREMLTAAKSAQKKLETTIGHEIRLDAFVDGDEKEFLTKES